MKRAWTALLLLGLAGAARAEKAAPRRDLADPDQFKQFVEGSRERQGLPEQLPPAAAQGAPSTPKPLPAYTPGARKASLDQARMPRWKPISTETPRQQGVSTGQLAALGGIGAMAALAGLSLRRSAPLDEPLAESGEKPLPRPEPEPARPEIPVDLEPLPPEAKG